MTRLAAIFLTRVFLGWLSITSGAADEVDVIGRSGNIQYGYSADAAKDLHTITTPSINDPVFGTIDAETDTFGHDRAGRVNSVSDRSGQRGLTYTKGHLTDTTYSANVGGALDGYTVHRAYDNYGNESGVTVSHNGTLLHSLVYEPDPGGHAGLIKGMDDGGAGFVATYHRTGSGRIDMISRGPLVQNWGTYYFDIKNRGTPTGPLSIFEVNASNLNR